ncbi:phosphotransferase-like protein [Rickettsiales endosymbiont of Stachyamoeba lipophora]|uniref:phosphotransferase-like protein n=1 Tax=Rickettsiales endosymbiont of Stachyamoeba lipophora TaxID=2486578 RepID=UPI000F64DCE9|nr:hypothetical protein [Rickettsiales endosymbiont of Stachyamoeba lipophora]AZL16327.1 hypothetical protein EF513_07295 [Rickettsiales endosymbiont of Stachyamoeba lipophora]
MIENLLVIKIGNRTPIGPKPNNIVYIKEELDAEKTRLTQIPLANFYKEWSLWSRCFGRVIAINGVSSSGKSTLGKALIKFGFTIISIDNVYTEILFERLSKKFTEIFDLLTVTLKKDDIIKIICGYKINNNIFKRNKEIIQQLLVAIDSNRNDILSISPLEQYKHVYAHAKKYIFRGENVTLDLVISSQSRNDLLSYSFNYYPIVRILLHCPLEENIRRCFERNDEAIKTDTFNYRDPVMIVNQYNTFYEFSKTNFQFQAIGKLNNKKSIWSELNNILTSSFYSTKVFTEELLLEKINNAKNTIKNLVSSLGLGSQEDSYIIPRIEYDYLVNNTYAIEKISSLANYLSRGGSMVDKYIFQRKKEAKNFMSI